MDAKLEFIANCFKYNTSLTISKMIELWTDKLKIEIKEVSKNSFMIITKTLDETYNIMKELDNSEGIPTDCRFFAMFMRCLKNNPNIPNIFQMHLNLKSLELMVPEGCLYITLDSDKFVLSKDKENPTFVTQGALQSDQGQWIGKWGDQYIGIGDDGVLKLERSEWKDRYNKCVNKYLISYETIIMKRHNLRNTFGNSVGNSVGNNSMNDMNNMNNIYRKAYLGLLSTLVKMHGICVCVYKFNNNVDNMVECV